MRLRSSAAAVIVRVPALFGSLQLDLSKSVASFALSLAALALEDKVDGELNPPGREEELAVFLDAAEGW